MKRLLGTACVMLAVFTGTSLVSAGADGVGPSESGSTGTDRACEVHAQNKGKSHARGLDCPSPTTTTTLPPTTSTSTTSTSTTSTSTTTTTVVSSATLDARVFECFEGFAVFVEITGTGLAPGTNVTVNGVVFGQVDAAGNFTITEGTQFNYTMNIAATTAEGTTITETFVTPATC